MPCTTCLIPEGKPQVVNGAGTFESYHEDGSINETGLIEDGLRTGEWVSYSPDHTASVKSTYVAGKLEGNYKAYFQDGAINVEGFFQGNKRTGNWKWYTVDGNIESDVTYVNGEKDGVQKFYDESGEVIRTETYKAGELVASQVN
jgi:uncharacterized protein